MKCMWFPYLYACYVKLMKCAAASCLIYEFSFQIIYVSSTIFCVSGMMAILNICAASLFRGLTIVSSVLYMFIYAEWMYLLFVAKNVCNDRFQTEGLHQHQMLPCLFSKDKTGSVFMKYLVSTEFPHVCYLTGIWTFVAGNFNSSARATLCTYT